MLTWRQIGKQISNLTEEQKDNAASLVLFKSTSAAAPHVIDIEDGLEINDEPHAPIEGLAPDQPFIRLEV